MKKLLSFISFIAAIVFGIIAMNTPPLAVIDSSVLWFTAQMLLFSATMLGVDFKITDLKDVFKTGKDSQSLSDDRSE